MTALVARGTLAGALGGLCAGGLDFALSASQAAAFLPNGRGRLLFFLCALYGFGGATIGALTAALAAGLGWATDLGGLWRAAFATDDAGSDGGSNPGADAPVEGGRLVAYAIAIVGAGALVSFVARLTTADALVRYHHRGLIAGLVGAAAAGALLATVPLVFVVAAALTPLVRVGPRAKLRFLAPPAVELGAWTLGLVAGAGAVGALLLRLQAMPRMPHTLKAFNTGLWAPFLVLVPIAIAHVLARSAGRVIAGRSRADGSPVDGSRALGGTRGLSYTPAGAALALLLAIVVPFAILAVANWATVKQLDHRAFGALSALALVSLAAALLGAGRPLARLRPWARAAFVVAVPSLCAVLGLSTGKSDRVRKAAVSFSGLTAPVVRAIHAATDFDHDGYSSVLGGGDCNDLDRDVHPGAFDWPDDGIDQDCNGHEATLAAPPPRPWAAVPPSVPAAPNVVLITLDALRADHVGAYGYARPTTPRLDELAAQSVRFANGWAHAPSTRYSVPAILTGRYPSTIAVGHTNWPPELLPENRLFAEIMKDLGYKTAAMLSYYYFNRGWGIDQGFDDYDFHLQTLHSIGGDPSKTQGSSARQLADLDVDYIAKHKDEKFFLWTHFYDTHFGFEKHPDTPGTDFGDDEVALYDGEIRYSDLHVGRVLDAIKAAGLWDKTIIIVTSDHGDGFGEHGLPQTQRHGYHLYRNETQVPILIRIPGVAPRVVDEPVGHIDLLPTLLNALGRPAAAEPQLLGESVLDLMLGAHRPRQVFQEVWYEGPTSRKAVVTSDWHLIRNLIPDDTVELYDLRNDPLEEHDRAGDGAPSERALSTELAAWMDAAALPADFRKKVEGNLSTSALPFTEKLGDTLGDFLTLEGVDLKTPTVAPGADLELSLILHGTARPDGPWRLFTHVVGADGRRINADHEPLEGLFPLSRLRAGTWLRDRVKVHLPPNWPAGPLTVEVGLWRSPARAQARGPHSHADAVRAATVPVGAAP